MPHEGAGNSKLEVALQELGQLLSERGFLFLDEQLRQVNAGASVRDFDRILTRLGQVSSNIVQLVIAYFKSTNFRRVVSQISIVHEEYQEAAEALENLEREYGLRFRLLLTHLTLGSEGIHDFLLRREGDLFNLTIITPTSALTYRIDQQKLMEFIEDAIQQLTRGNER